MSFLPPAPKANLAAAELVEPPVLVQPNVYLKEIPAFLNNATATGSARHLEADAMARRADQQYQRGRRYFQSGDIASARREFDAAVDTMLDAAAANPSGRSKYQRALDDMVEAIHRLDLAGMGASADIDPNRFEKAPLEDILEMTFPVDPRLRDRVREQVAATTSQLPLTVNDAVTGYIHYFSQRAHRTIVNGLQRGGRYRTMIERVLDEEGVPRELFHLAQAESGFMPKARSRASAVGMWQFMASRGEQYGLRRTSMTDDRMDPEKATRAAARHLHDLYDEFGDWYLALAAYNWGPVRVEQAVERSGYADFWELRARGFLPAETTNYVPIILAMTIMEKNAAEYGLTDLQVDPPLEYDTVALESDTSLQLVADVTEMPLSEISSLNPGVLSSVAPEGYALHIPKGAGNSLVAALRLIPASRRDSWRLHRVSAGETLAEVGKRYSVAPASISGANSTVSAEPMEGDLLVIPAAYRTSSRATATSSKASRKSSSRAALSSGRSSSKTHTAKSSSSSSKSTSTSKKAGSRRTSSKKSATVKTAAAPTAKSNTLVASATR